MGTKDNPAPNDCYHKAFGDEPMFTLIARDPFAARLVRHWADLRVMGGENAYGDEKIDEAMRCASDMEHWYTTHRGGDLPEGWDQTLRQSKRERILGAGANTDPEHRMVELFGVSVDEMKYDELRATIDYLSAELFKERHRDSNQD